MYVLKSRRQRLAVDPEVFSALLLPALSNDVLSPNHATAPPAANHFCSTAGADETLPRSGREVNMPAVSPSRHKSILSSPFSIMDLRSPSDVHHSGLFHASFAMPKNAMVTYDGQNRQLTTPNGIQNPFKLSVGSVNTGVHIKFEGPDGSPNTARAVELACYLAERGYLK